MCKGVETMKPTKEPSYPDTYRIKQSNYEKLGQLVQETGLSKVAIINLLIEQATVEELEGKGWGNEKLVKHRSKINQKTRQYICRNEAIKNGFGYDKQRKIL